MNRVFSTRELAALCGVNESTIKRWADSGRLDCVKTPGGHRKFRGPDVYLFLQQHGYDTSALAAVAHDPSAVGSRMLESALAALPPLPEPLLRAITAHDSAPLVAACLTASGEQGNRTTRQIGLHLLAAGWSVVDICEDVISPALDLAGTGWAEGRVTIMEEHLLTASTIHALSALKEDMPRVAPNGLRALCCSGEADQHNVGVRMTSLVLESAGWSVAVCLSPTPMVEVSRYLEQSRPDLLCISLTCEPVDPEFAGKFGRILNLARQTGARVAVGGRGSDPVRSLGADFTGRDLREFMAWADRLAADLRRVSSPTPGAHART